MRTTRLRERIKRFLAEKGEANTTEILEHVNTTTRHGTTRSSWEMFYLRTRTLRRYQPRNAAVHYPADTISVFGDCESKPVNFDY